MMYTSRVTTAVLGLLLVISGAMASPASSRKLLQNCSGGCASWIGWGVRRTCAACCTGYILQNGLCVASTTSVTTTPVVVPVGGVPVYPARPVYPVRPVTPVRRPVGGVATTTTTAGVVVTNPPGPRDRTAVAGKTTTTRAAGFGGSRGLKQVATGADTAGRHLLQGCAGGCASWINQSGGRRRCGACCAGYAMRNGVCAKQTTTVRQNPYGGVTATRTQRAAGWHVGH